MIRARPATSRSLLPHAVPATGNLVHLRQRSRAILYSEFRTQRAMSQVDARQNDLPAEIDALSAPPPPVVGTTAFTDFSNSRSGS